MFYIFLNFFLETKEKTKKKKSKFSLKLQGGEDSQILQNIYDKYFNNDLYVQVNDNRMKQIIRKMFTAAADKPLIIYVEVYLLVLLKNKYAPLILQNEGTKLIVSNFRGFIDK